MTSWAIVAIPEEGDSTWKMSSEDVPHLTILFLGEQDDQGDALHISEYLQHIVSKSVNRFWLDVERRGPLGDKEADVLFFDSRMNKRTLSDLADFRAWLLQDPVIARLHGSVEQFDQWTPHLTMGYPEKPAKKWDPKTSPYGSDKIYSVYFDKIAFWVGDSEGPTFDLEYKDSIALASDSVEHRLQHRRGLEQQFVRPLDLLMRSTLRQSQTPVSRVDMTPLPITYSSPSRAAVLHSIAAMKASVGILKHADDQQSAFLRHMYDAMPGYNDRLSHRRISVAICPDGDWLLSLVDLDTNQGTVEHRIHPVADEHGVVSDYELVEGGTTPEDARFALKHYGVPGMKWGRRRASDVKGAVSAAKGAVSGKLEERRQTIAKSKTLEGNAGSGTTNKRDKAQDLADKREAKKFDTKSNFKKPEASEEARVNNQALKRTKDHGTDMMSNKELQAMVTRMNLEQQYKALAESDKPRSARQAGKEYAADILKQAGQEIAVELIKGAVASGGAAAKNQATNSNSRSRTFVSTTAGRARSRQAAISPAVREILQLPPGRG